MKIHSQNSNRGGVLVTALLVCVVVGIMLIAYLSMVSSQHSFTQRSQIWNNCIPMCEAGVEEAMAHINHINTTSNFAINGWVLSGGNYRKERDLNQGTYRMAVANDMPPTITVAGSLRAPINVGSVTRTVRIKTKLNQRFPNGILSKGLVDLGGSARVDSFNSTNASESTGGAYDPAKFTDRASVVTVSKNPGEMILGNAEVYGSVGTGPGGTVTMGPNGNAGSTAYNNDPAYNGTVEPGHYQDDVNVYVPDGMLPIPFGPALMPGPGLVGVTLYDYVLGDGDYRIGSISLSGTKKMIVTGKARIHVLGGTSLSGMAYILIGSGASVEWYAGGAVDLGGGGMVNTPGLAKNFSLIGLNTCLSVSYSGSAAFTGTIYAPAAAVKISGNAAVSGAFVGKSFQIIGTADVHYDEALKGNPKEGRFLAASWQEL